jgi:multidrug transporter EmrE-like cation transporter
MSHIYIFLTIFFTVYGQIVIKWQVNSAGTLPIEPSEKVVFILRLLLNPWILSGLFSAFLASLTWMAAMTKFTLSYAYPFISLTFVLIMLSAAIFFREPITPPKVFGIIAIVAGVIVGAKG